jgi:branched-chain amino acid transport system substrate-binding protein
MGGIAMTLPISLRRRHVLAGAAGLLAAPAIILRSAAAATRGVSDTEIVIGCATDLSGVAAVQGTNAANAMWLAMAEVNARGGVHGRRIRLIIEDMQYQVPKAVQAMNKLLNSDNIFFALGNGGTPMNNAVMQTMIEKQVPNIFPNTCARSMYEPFDRFKFGQFASYYDQMRACVRYFVERKGKKQIGVMYQDTDYGKDILSGVVAQTDAMGLKLAATTSHKPTDTDFNAQITRLRDSGCDLIVMGTIVRDTTLPLQTARKMEWGVDFVGNFATYSTAVAEAPGGPAEGFYSVSPSLYRYPNDSRPAVRALCERYKKAWGFDMNYIGQVCYTTATFGIAVLEKAGRDLTLDSLLAALESMTKWRDVFDGPLLTLTPTDHHASSESFLSVVRNARWVPVLEEPLSF